MEKFRLAGNPDRCVWCGKTCTPPFRETEFKEGTKKAVPHLVVVCSEQCEHDLINTEKKYEGKAPYFFIGIITGLLLGIAGTILMFNDLAFLIMCTSAIMVLGITFYLFPFVTPQTVQLYGYKKGFRIGKRIGLVLIMIGVFLSLAALVPIIFHI